MTEDVIEVRLHRARARLRDDLERQVGAAGRAAYDFHLRRRDRVVEAVMSRLREGAA